MCLTRGNPGHIVPKAGHIGHCLVVVRVFERDLIREQLVMKARFCKSLRYNDSFIRTIMKTEATRLHTCCHILVQDVPKILDIGSNDSRASTSPYDNIKAAIWQLDYCWGHRTQRGLPWLDIIGG